MIGRTFEKSLYHTMSLAYDIASTFVVSHQHAVHVLEQVVGKDDRESLDTIISESLT